MREQHGEIILEKVAEVPEGAKPINLRRGFVVESGKSGHAHILANVEGVTGYEKDGTLYFCLEKETQLLDHQEHGLQTYGPGIYLKGIELYFDVETEEAKETLD